MSDGAEVAEAGAVACDDAPRPLLQTIRADFDAFIDLDPVKGRGLGRYLDALTHPGFLAVVIYRVAAAAHRRGAKPVARLLMLVNFILFSTELSPRMTAGPGLVVAHPQHVAIGAAVRVGSRVRILRGVGMGTAGYRDASRDGFPTIGDGCLLSDGVRVFGPVEVGEHSILGTGVTLMRSVPARSLVTVEQPLVVQQMDGEGRTVRPAPSTNGRAAVPA